MKRKLLSALGCAVICAASCVSINADAAMYTNDGITAEIIADNNYYTADGTAEVLLKVTNNNDFAVSNVSIESVIPDGLRLVDTEKSGESVDSLAAGETMKLSVKVAKASAMQSGEVPSGNGGAESGQTGGQGGSQNTPAATTAAAAAATTQAAATTAATAATAASTSAESSPKTGSSSAVTAVIVLGMLAFVALMLTSKKRGARMLSLMITVSVCAGTFSRADIDAADNTNAFVVSENLDFGGDKYCFSVNTSYSRIIYDQSAVYTRGQWMRSIADLVGLTEDILSFDADTYDYFYGDTIGAENGMLFEYLNKYGAVPAPDNEGYTDPDQDIPLFEADKPVTREYAAYSAVKLLGFKDSPDAPVCGDAASLKYPAAVSTALKFNMLKTIGGNFAPDALLTQADYCQISAVIKAFEQSLVISEDETAHEYTYVDGVIGDQLADLTDFTVTDNGNGTYTAVLPFNDVTASIAQGTVFVLPPCDNFSSGISLKATGVVVNGSTVTVQAVMPEITEVLKNIYFMDTFQPDPADFIPDDGVTVSLGDSAESSGDAAPWDVDLIDIDKEFKPTVPLCFTKKFFDDCLEVEGSFSVPLISVVYKSHEELGFLSADYVTDEAMFCINAKAEANISLILLEASDLNGGDDVEKFLGAAGAIGGSNGTLLSGISARKDAQLRLGVIPVTLPAGFHADLEVFLKVDGGGKLTVGFAFDTTLGAQYINGESRNLNSFKPSVSKIELAAEVKVGPKLELSLGWTAFDHLIGVDAFGGVCISGALTAHPDAKLLCIDGSVYLFLELGLSEDTKLGGFLKDHGWEARADVINSDNTPWQLNAHFENFKKVDACTYGNGKLSIHVKDADDKSIKQALIKVYDLSGNRIKTVSTDSTGKAEIGDLPLGSVKIEIKATGYKIFNDRQLIRSNQTTYCEAVLMVSRDDEGSSNETGTGSNYVTGTVKDAATGSLIDASFKVRKGYNAFGDAEVVAEGVSENGRYKVTLPVGYYTLVFSKDGYVDSKVNAVVKAASPTTKNVVISTELGGGGEDTGSGDSDVPSGNVNTAADMRVVLTWGVDPEDLDSHLLSTDFSGYHIYFSNMDVYRDGEKVANLDVDDTTSYGPETTTVFGFKDGEKLSYYVHDYTNRDVSGDYMSNSGAHVVVYSGSNEVASFNTPIGVEGNLWHVFDLNTTTGEITPVNTYSTIGEDDYDTYFINNN